MTSLARSLRYASPRWGGRDGWGIDGCPAPPPPLPRLPAALLSEIQVASGDAFLARFAHDSAWCREFCFRASLEADLVEEIVLAAGSVAGARASCSAAARRNRRTLVLTHLVSLLPSPSRCFVEHYFQSRVTMSRLPRGRLSAMATWTVNCRPQASTHSTSVSRPTFIWFLC